MLIKTFKQFKQTDLTSCDKIIVQLKGNSIEQKQSQQIAQKLLGCPKLKILELNLSNNQLGANSISFISTSLSQCQLLDSLYLDLSQNFIGLTGIANLVENLSKCQSLSILKIDISQNDKILSQSFNALGNGLRSFKRLTTLNLIFEKDKISQGEMIHFNQKIKKTIRLVQIKNNN
ncbi:hypothetical protein ABPG74_000461 [Tetrahymena malaccensis]